MSDEILALYFLGIFMSLAIAFAIYAHRKTKKRPRPMATRKPWDDPRSSLRMHSKIVSRQ